jgi:hypothetical protein
MHGPGRKDGTPEPNKRMLPRGSFCTPSRGPFWKPIDTGLPAKGADDNVKRHRKRHTQGHQSDGIHVRGATVSELHQNTFQRKKDRPGSSKHIAAVERYGSVAGNAKRKIGHSTVHAWLASILRMCGTAKPPRMCHEPVGKGCNQVSAPAMRRAIITQRRFWRDSMHA